VRPAVGVSGWLCNGQRSPAVGALAAMEGVNQWRPPVETAASRHAVFLDVQLWDHVEDRRRWSCPMLAAVWQLLRLGLLRYEGASLVRPVSFKKWTDGGISDEWSGMPPIVQLNPHAAPFSAYRTSSVLPVKYLPVEHAVQTIINQVSIDPVVLQQVARRSLNEGMTLPDVVGRVGYLFTT
jgi:hypothetical protein